MVLNHYCTYTIKGVSALSMINSSRGSDIVTLKLLCTSSDKMFILLDLVAKTTFRFRRRVGYGSVDVYRGFATRKAYFDNRWQLELI